MSLVGSWKKPRFEPTWFDFRVFITKAHLKVIIWNHSHVYTLDMEFYDSGSIVFEYFTDNNSAK